MTHRTFLHIALASLLAAACAKHQPPPQAASAAPLPQPPSRQQLADVKVVKMTVEPASIRHDQQATVSIELSGAPAGTDVTLAWFGPDGWLKHDELKSLNGNSATFVVQAGTFREPGRYHAALRSNVVHLGDATLDVTG